MRLAEHPWHALAVHFPVALLSLDSLLELWAWAQPQQSLGGLPVMRLADVLLWSGLLLALPAIGLGLRDWLRFGPRKPLAVNVFSAHLLWVSLALSIYLLAALLPPGSPIRVISSGLAALMLMAGGWYGARLVHEIGLTRADQAEPAGDQDMN